MRRATESNAYMQSITGDLLRKPYHKQATTTMETGMNTAKMSQEFKVEEGGTDKQVGEAGTLEKGSNAMRSALSSGQRVAICFVAGVVGATAVVLCSYVLFGLGLSGVLGIKAPIPLKSPDIYRPLFWGGLWGLLFGVFIKRAWNRLYLVGFLYYLAPMAALFFFFLPMSGAGFLGLNKGPEFGVYLLLVNLPFGIVTALAARAIIGKYA
jgi:hypothetical protein